MVLIASGYAGYFYDEESICGTKLNAGPDYDTHAAGSTTVRRRRLFAEAAAAGIDKDSMKSLNNDILLETILEKAGIEKAGDRLMIILQIHKEIRWGSGGRPRSEDLSC